MIGEWRFNGRPAAGRKFIALGRREWYSAFANNQTQVLGTKVYLCDFMDWIDEKNPERSLYYFIDSAERIDVCLKGILQSDLDRATVGIGKSASRQELRLPHMTGWEINQLFHRGYLGKTYWHVADGMTPDQAFQAMGRRVPKERITAITDADDAHLAARSLSAERIIGYYEESHFVELASLLKQILTRSWGKYLKFYDGYGTLVVEVTSKGLQTATGIMEITGHHEGVFIVQVHDHAKPKAFWDRNMDTKTVGNFLIDLLKKTNLKSHSA
jgi:hypothetical protein